MGDFSKYNYSELIIQLKGDSVEAFNEIYHRMLPKLYGFLASLYNDQNLIEEVTSKLDVDRCIWLSRFGFVELADSDAGPSIACPIGFCNTTGLECVYLCAPNVRAWVHLVMSQSAGRSDQRCHYGEEFATTPHKA